MIYIHYYETKEAFEADYNGSGYTEPWVSLSPSLTVTGLTMRDEFVWSEGATWVYECERDAVDELNGGAPGPMGTRHVYEWTWYDEYSMTHVHAATLVRNPSVGTPIYASGENGGEWFFVSQQPSEVLTVSTTGSELPVKVDYNKGKKNYFTIEATQDGTTIYFRQSSFAVDDDLDPLKVEVSTDDGHTWTEVTAAPAEGNVSGATLAELDEGEKVLIRGRNEAYGHYYSGFSDIADNCNFYADKPCYVYGNIMSLVGGDDFEGVLEVEEYAFAWLFSDYNEELDWSWVLSKEGEELLLPATALANYCYYCMFYNCTGLVTAPKLPATTLSNYCYNGMFQNCTSLTAAPKLPATTLADNCYGYMFSSCTGLIVAPALPATTLAPDCYSGMFYGCTGLTVAPELPTTTLANACYRFMFYGCTGLTTAPELPATTLAEDCYYGMFHGCTSLTTAPELPAVTLEDYCYGSMFRECTNLSYIKAMFTTTPGTNYTGGWVYGVKATGTFVKNSAAAWSVTGVNGVPTGWTVQTA